MVVSKIVLQKNSFRHKHTCAHTHLATFSKVTPSWVVPEIQHLGIIETGFSTIWMPLMLPSQQRKSTEGSQISETNQNHLLALKVICNGFSQNYEKVVSSCLLQYKPVCVINFDKLRCKMLKRTTLVVCLV